MELNKEQQQVYDLAIQENDIKVILLKGSPGTGKTETLKRIIKDYPGTVLVTATTNKAKALLQEAIPEDREAPYNQAYTTHSAMGFSMIKSGYDEVLSKVREPMLADLLIVDEISMLPSVVHKAINPENYKKILYVGDELQLGAIGHKAEIVADVEVNLTQQMRQNDDDEALKDFFYRMRNIIKTGKKESLISKCPLNVMTYDRFKDFANAYKACKGSKRILAYTNKVVDSYNKNISGKNHYQVDDLLMLDRPARGGFKNGDIVRVTKVKEEDHRYSISFVNEQGYNGFGYVYKSKAYEKRDLDEEASDSLSSYWDLRDRILHPKHLFASTVHKAQGQTLDEVFIDLRDIFMQTTKRPTQWNNYAKPMSFDEYYRLLYVAISRMRVKAHIFFGKDRDYKLIKGK